MREAFVLLAYLLTTLVKLCRPRGLYAVVAESLAVKHQLQDLDGHKGVYHINTIDEITQFEIVASVERISEAFLLPALETLLDAFPFVIRGFHSDNGSERE